VTDPRRSEDQELANTTDSVARTRRKFMGTVATTVLAGAVLGAERAGASEMTPERSAAPTPTPKTMTADEILEVMRRSMGEVPPAIAKSVPVDPGLIMEHARSRAFAMPAGKAALDDTTRTLIYLAAALAGSSPACVRAMSNRSVVLNIPKEKIVETVRIVRLAMATKIIGDSEALFDALRPA
jgi:alkylhydroperoxidase/carboxymuconolactone decarboxylase family protein YurZ